MAHVADESVRVERSGARTTVIWERPPVNVFNIALLDQLAHTLRSAPVRSANVVVLKGARHRWSAGFDVEDHLSDRLRPMLEAFRDLVRALWEVPGPTLAQVEGPCLGGAVELLAACDLALAAESATFGQPEVRLGVFPPFTTALGPRMIGPKRTAELVFLGETLSARRAETFGLLNGVVAESSLEEEVDRVTERLCGYRSDTLVLLKKAVHASNPLPWTEMERVERIYLDELMNLPKAEEGLRAFLEKREPHWPPRAG